VPVTVDVTIDPTIETVTPTFVIVNVPLASAKRPVPPVIVLTFVDSLPVDVTVPVPVKPLRDAEHKHRETHQHGRFLLVVPSALPRARTHRLTANTSEEPALFPRSM
jgi:hypothetical protein